MTYKIALPGRTSKLDIVDPNSTQVQRALRRGGLAAYEPPTLTTLLTLFDQESESLTFFDVGANMGLYAAVCAVVFRPRAVHAFEPTPTTAAVARAVVQANGLEVEIVEAALGDEDGSAALHLSDKSDSSNSLVAGFKPSSHSVQVPVRRLDDYAAAAKIAPTVIKIDVETHEAAMLAGAVRTIAATRPYIVIEVLNRRGHDHGTEITAAMEPFGYCYYRLGSVPDWVAQPIVTGAENTTNSDWLLAPAQLPEDFAARWDRWSGQLAECGPDANSRVPLILSVRAAFRRGGMSEVIAASRRFVAAIRRGGDQKSS